MILILREAWSDGRNVFRTAWKASLPIITEAEGDSPPALFSLCVWALPTVWKCKSHSETFSLPLLSSRWAELKTYLILVWGPKFLVHQMRINWRNYSYQSSSWVKILRFSQHAAKLGNHCSKWLVDSNSLLAVTAQSYQTIPDHVGWSSQFSVLILHVTDDNASSLIYIRFHLSSRMLHVRCHFRLVPVYSFSASSCAPNVGVLQKSVLDLLVCYI